MCYCRLLPLLPIWIVFSVWEETLAYKACIKGVYNMANIIKVDFEFLVTKNKDKPNAPQ